MKKQIKQVKYKPSSNGKDWFGKAVEGQHDSEQISLKYSYITEQNNENGIEELIQLIIESMNGSKLVNP
jgi:disulfide oxidoreductase YuzD